MTQLRLMASEGFYRPVTVDTIDLPKGSKQVPEVILYGGDVYRRRGGFGANLYDRLRGAAVLTVEAEVKENGRAKKCQDKRSTSTTSSARKSGG